jgi:hypothetical protein
VLALGGAGLAPLLLLQCGARRQALLLELLRELLRKGAAQGQAALQGPGRRTACRCS